MGLNNNGGSVVRETTTWVRIGAIDPHALHSPWAFGSSVPMQIRFLRKLVPILKKTGYQGNSVLVNSVRFWYLPNSTELITETYNSRFKSYF
jgi:hypothetical protein